MRTKSILPALLLCSAFSPDAFFAQNPCDTVAIVAQASATNMTCDNPVATLTGALHPSALSYHWSGPGGFSSDTRVAFTTKKGPYTLTVTGLYGCTAQASVTVADQCTSYPLVPPACDPPYTEVIPAEDCWDACVMPYLPETVYYNTAGYSPGVSAENWCGTIENDQWFAFVAGATAGSITATPFNCTNGDGIQIGLYEDCPGFLPLACNGGGMGFGDIPVTINVSGLHLGEVYYLVVDGFAGDQCEFLFGTTGGVCDNPIQTPLPPLSVQGPSLVCPEGTANYQVLNLGNSIATAFLWTAPGGSSINGLTPPALIYKPDGESVTVTFGDESGFVCMRQIYYFYPPSPPICFYINNEPIDPTILSPVTVCNEDLPYELPWGDLVFATGTYQATLESYLGCDSLVEQEVIVKPPIVSNIGSKVRCAGECFEIGGDLYCQGGNYSVVLESYQGCDSLVNFQLTILNPIAKILGNDTLTCSQTVVALSSASSPGNKIWKNAAGQILGVGNTLNVTQPGLYILNTTQILNGVSCQQTDSILIQQDIAPVQAAAQGGTLTCSNLFVALAGSASDPLALLNWIGPNGFTASGPNPGVTLPGVYQLVATGCNGCIGTAVAIVEADLQAPALSVSGGTLTCATSEIQLAASSPGPGVTYAWTGPNGFSAAVPNPAVDAPGPYECVATAPNGCTASAGTSVATDQQAPALSVSGGTLTCATSEIQLAASSPEPGVTYAWTGPNGFSAAVPNPAVDVPGPYECVVTAPNGCTASAGTSVVTDQQAPALSVSGGTLTCTTSEIQLAASSPEPGVTYAWTGPNGFSAAVPNPAVDVPGPYECVATAPNGCTASAGTSVEADLQAPTLGIGGGTLTCANPQILLSDIAGNPLFDYVWTGPDGWVFTGPEPVVSVPGVYTCVAAAPNGCTASVEIVIESDQSGPLLGLSADTIVCTGAEARVYAGAVLPNLLYSWAGPNGFTAGEPAPVVVTPGLYAVTATDPANGCTSSGSIEVAGDLNLPSLDVSQLAPGCGDTLLFLDATSSVADVQFHWTGPDFFTSNEEDPVVVTPGWYKVTASTVNGCEGSINILVVAAPAVPQINLTGGLLSCFQPSAALQASADLAVTEYAWTGPGNFASDEANPLATVPGFYALTLTAANGCTAAATVEVVGDFAAPDLAATGGVLTCAQPVTTISATSTTQNAVLSWLGPGWPAGQSSVEVSEPGEYTAVATAPNGCTATVTVTVADSCSTGAHELAAQSGPAIRVFPNASTGLVFVEALRAAGLDAVRVFAADGRLVWSGDFAAPTPRQRLDLTSWPAGVYVVTARIGERWFAEQLILVE